MPALVRTRAADLLEASLGISTLTAFTGDAKIRLTTTAPSATSAGTELVGTGYTAGGQTITFNSTSTASTTGPTSAITWTNSGGSSWPGIVGLEIWDSAAPPVRWWFGLWTGQPLVVAAGNSFVIQTGAITVQI